MRTAKRGKASNVADAAFMPYFKSDKEAEEYWDNHEFTEFPKLVYKLGQLLKKRGRENKKLIALKVEPSLLGAIKIVAGAKGLGYSALIRMWLLERLESEQSQYMERIRR